MLRKILFALGGVAFVLAKSANGGGQINYSDVYGECISKYGRQITCLSCLARALQVKLPARRWRGLLMD